MWTPRESDRGWRGIANSADGTKLVAVAENDYIYISNDSGVTWTPYDSPRNWYQVAMSSNGSKIAAVEWPGLIYISSDGGITWNPTESYRDWTDITISYNGNRLAATSYDGQIYISQDGGNTWSSHEQNRFWSSIDMSSDGSKLIASVWGGKIYFSDDFGYNWTETNIDDHNFIGVSISGSGSKLIAVAYAYDPSENNRIYISLDNGDTWQEHQNSLPWVDVDSSNNGNILAAIVGGEKIYISTNGGISWESQEDDRLWNTVTVSRDGRKLAAAVYGGQIYTTEIIVPFVPSTGGRRTSTTTTTTQTTTTPEPKYISNKESSHLNNTQPCNPFIDFTTTTSTTTVAPTLEYFSLPTSGVLCPQDPCVCGSIFIPVGAKHSPNGSFISINNNRYSLVHDNDAFLEKEQLFISTTTKLIPPQNSNNLLTNNIIINLGQDLNLINVIQVIVKIRETKKTIGQLILGSFDSATPINNINIQLTDTFNLTNLTLQIEIISLCKNSKQVCCDALPSSVTLSNIIDTIYCSTTTTLPPFCAKFNLPDTFYMTIRGYGLLEGQEHYNLVTRSGNTWYTSGTFPCGANYYISMTCNSNTQSFIYDGYVDCCEASTKTIIGPTFTPYLFPNTISPPIISYTDCFCDFSCSTTTTTTSTTTDFPTTAPPPPPVPCEQTSSLIINGYAFYRDVSSTVNVPGIGQLRTPCYGGHICNRTDFIPQIITNTKTISASQISLNNYPGGGDRTQTFSFVIDDTSILKDGASVSLKCASLNNNCHNGVTWIVLTTQINDKTLLLFNSCVLPNSIDNLDFECIDCCKWDGVGSIEFNNVGNGLSKSLQFYQIGEDLWEYDSEIDCGDRLSMIIKCNKNIKFDIESPNLDALCKNKWELVHFNFPCAINPRLTGNLLIPCECDKPPIFEFTADNINNCDRCNANLLGYTHYPLGYAPEGYQWTFVNTEQDLYKCKVLITGNPNYCTGHSLNTELSSSLLDWVRSGGIFLYQDEFSGCGDANLANLAMSQAGSTMISQGGIWGNFDYNGGHLTMSSNSPCIQGLSFIGALSANIVGGTPLLTIPPDTNVTTMMGQNVGNGCVILLGDINIVLGVEIYDPTTGLFSYGQNNIPWTEFLRRLLTTQASELL